MLVHDLLSGLAPCLSPSSGLRDPLTTRLHAPSLASSAIITLLPHLLCPSLLTRICITFTTLCLITYSYLIT